mmetsp:Transcript_70583/g.111634  ORF Transcript_70583/g.111634 Transcript_70583/m.111634 type:complete len:88 (-) Transcript_70583:280-543(-)
MSDGRGLLPSQRYDFASSKQNGPLIPTRLVPGAGYRQKLREKIKQKLSVEEFETCPSPPSPEHKDEGHVTDNVGHAAQSEQKFKLQL